jgi:hypothetical protein
MKMRINEEKILKMIRSDGRIHRRIKGRVLLMKTRINEEKIM